ncbi:MAG TPA: hypothetical protein VFO19_04825 [Vicinamibacterales bacterium]|nr:hypothetical protein [Vicinamibacterales bacterium]
MLRMLSRHRTELGVPATPRELDAAIARTIAHLQSATATVAIARAELSGGRLEIEVAVENQAGHKFPTAYPSRRAWLHLSVRDDAGRVVFESGAVRPDGSIAGNDNDADPRRVEPHYTRIASADDVQIYESMMVDPAGVVTTGLLTGARFVKDNRLLPHGFDKAGAAAEIAVQGHAAADADFVAGSDRITYAIDLGSAAGPYTVAVALRYQPIAYRWAQNLKAYDAPEPRRFVAWYEEMADVSSLAVAAASRTVR